jgi:hypothetical protein
VIYGEAHLPPEEIENMGKEERGYFNTLGKLWRGDR